MCVYRYDPQGKAMNKKNTFLDFIASAEYLVDQGFTSAGRICISGGSAGGMLVSIYWWVTAHMWVSHGTHVNHSRHMNESWYTCVWVMAHMWMCHRTRGNESWCTCYQVLACMWLSHGQMWSSKSRGVSLGPIDFRQSWATVKLSKSIDRTDTPQDLELHICSPVWKFDRT